MSVLWFLLIVGISIFVHELGHYLAARLQKVEVRTFAVGFGPSLLSFNRWGTSFRLNLIPLGGYAEIDGMVQLPGQPPHGYARLGVPGKLLVLLGGVFMNLLLAWSAMAYLDRGQDPAHAAISRVTPGSIAEKAGIQAGDVVVAIDGKPTALYTDISKVKEVPGDHTLDIRRGGETVMIRLSIPQAGQLIGIQYGIAKRDPPLPFYLAFADAIRKTVEVAPRAMTETLKSLFQLVGGKRDDNLMGPVGVAVITQDAAKAGATGLLALLLMLNFSLAIFNLLPIPVLDGGRVVFVLLTALLGLVGIRLKPEHEAYASYAGMAFLLLVFLMVTSNDLRRIFGGG